jgi:phenylacetate-CoA ligase
VRQFKIIQESLQKTRVLLVTDPDFDDAGIHAIRSGIARRMGGQAHIDIQRVAEIAAEASGKYRYVVSHVDLSLRQEAA